jgi:hypothetical protein
MLNIDCKIASLPLGVDRGMITAGGNVSGISAPGSTTGSGESPSISNPSQMTAQMLPTLLDESGRHDCNTVPPNFVE